MSIVRRSYRPPAEAPFRQGSYHTRCTSSTAFAPSRRTSRCDCELDMREHSYGPSRFPVSFQLRCFSQAEIASSCSHGKGSSHFLASKNAKKWGVWGTRRKQESWGSVKLDFCCLGYPIYIQNSRLQDHSGKDSVTCVGGWRLAPTNNSLILSSFLLF